MKFFPVVVASLCVVDATSFSLLTPSFFNEKTKSILQRQDDFMKDFFEDDLFDMSLKRWDDRMMKTKKTELPRYELVNNDDRFEVAVHVPQSMTPEHLHVTVDKDKHRMTIQGKFEKEEAGAGTYSKRSESFSQSFLLDPAVLVDGFQANFEEKDRVLKIVAPKDMKLLEAPKEERVQEIPITAAAGDDDTMEQGEVDV